MLLLLFSHIYQVYIILYHVSIRIYMYMYIYLQQREKELIRRHVLLYAVPDSDSQKKTAAGCLDSAKRRGGGGIYCASSSNETVKTAWHHRAPPATTALPSHPHVVQKSTKLGIVCRPDSPQASGWPWLERERGASTSNETVLPSCTSSTFLLVDSNSQRQEIVQSTHRYVRSHSPPQSIT